MLFTSPISLLFFLTIVPLLSFMMTGRRGVLHDSFFENIQPLISPFFEETWLRKWNHIDAASHATIVAVRLSMATQSTPIECRDRNGFASPCRDPWMNCASTAQRPSAS